LSAPSGFCSIPAETGERRDAATYMSAAAPSSGWDVPEKKLRDDRDALVQPLAVRRCDLDLIIVSGKSGLAGPFAPGREAAGRVVE